MPNCRECEREEIARATACGIAEDAADAKGEKYECPCPPRPDCTHAKPETLPCGCTTHQFGCLSRGNEPDGFVR